MISCKAFFTALLCASIAAASPLANANLFNRQECAGPTVTTTTIYSPSQVFGVYLSTQTGTVTATIYSHVTKTITEVYTQTITKTKSIKTDVVTVPITTLWEDVIVGTTTTNPYPVFTVTTTLPGTPDPCYTLTCTKIISDSTTYTYPVFYAHTITTLTARSTTITKLIPKTITSKLYVGKSTTTLTIVTSTIPATIPSIVFETSWVTAYSTPGPLTCAA
ncbi:hypothetical protein TWF694_006698 [Orbilia ellipsospora]|uniref:Uncharacterized protein n=1 Tax=Orbilia ellipsospora TaxID=2528407 RepID=A0AAV9XMG0_9PEZI